MGFWLPVSFFGIMSAIFGRETDGITCKPRFTIRIGIWIGRLRSVLVQAVTFFTVASELSFVLGSLFYTSDWKYLLVFWSLPPKQSASKSCEHKSVNTSSTWRLFLCSKSHPIFMTSVKVVTHEPLALHVLSWNDMIHDFWDSHHALGIHLNLSHCCSLQIYGYSHVFTEIIIHFFNVFFNRVCFFQRIWSYAMFFFVLVCFGTVVDCLRLFIRDVSLSATWIFDFFLNCLSAP